MNRRRRAGVVLCGGRSSRMGKPKHLLEIHGRTFLECCLTALSGVVDQLFLSVASSQDPLALDFKVTMIEDRHPEGGPLSGLAAALQAVDAEQVAVLSCDAPLIKPGVLTQLFDGIGANDASLPTAFGRVQYFPGVYRRSVGAIAQRLLEQNERRMSALVSECKCNILTERQILVADPTRSSFLSVNTPDEYEALVRRFRRD